MARQSERDESIVHLLIDLKNGKTRLLSGIVYAIPSTNAYDAL
jgi:hypothetical protein